MLSLKDTVVVITGSSRGLGYAMAREFLNAGARVVISSRDGETVDRAVAALLNPGNVFGMVCDARDLGQMRALADATVAQFGQIDVWVNNAGLSPGWGPLMKIDPEKWRASFETNFFGAANGCRVALEKMLPRQSGHIVNVLGAGVNKPAPNQSAYGTAKAAIARLTETLAIENADTGIIINAVMPGMIWTDMLLGAKGVDEPSRRARFEWAMRVFGNPPAVPAKFVLRMAQRGGGNGKTFSVLSPRTVVPRMLGEMLGAGKRNPQPWNQ